MKGLTLIHSTTRSSPSQMFLKIGAFKNFANFTGKHLCWSFFLLKFQTLRPATLLKSNYNTGIFSVQFAEFLRTPFFTEQFQWLLPYTRHDSDYVAWSYKKKNKSKVKNIKESCLEAFQRKQVPINFRPKQL